MYYNRFRYYDPSTGGYISQDPIGLEGNNPTLYSYVFDPNIQIDLFGLDCTKLNSKQKKQIMDLRKGKDVYVKNIKEARMLLHNMPELRPHVDKFPANSGELFYGTIFSDVWKQPRGTYRGDLINTKNPTSNVVHTSGNRIHDTNPHYNILNHDGRKSAIIITN